MRLIQTLLNPSLEQQNNSSYLQVDESDCGIFDECTAEVLVGTKPIEFMLWDLSGMFHNIYSQGMFYNLFSLINTKSTWNFNS